MAEYPIPGGAIFNEDTSLLQYPVPGGFIINEITSGTTIVESDGSATCSAVVSAVALAFFLGTGAVSGAGAVSADSAVIKPTVGNATGVATVDSPTTGITDATFSTTGVGAVSGSSAFVRSTAGSLAGISAINGIGGFLNQGTASATGASSANVDSTIAEIATTASAGGFAVADAHSRVIAGSVFNAAGSTSKVEAIAPGSLTPSNFKPIEQRRIRLPRLPRGLPSDQWIEIANREFDSFFNDLHHYLASNTFVNGVHTEVLGHGFTLTPETSTIFIMSNEAVVSDPITAIKNVTNVPRYFTIVNTGLFPVTLRDDANTRFGGADIILQSGRIITLIYTGEAWVGNAL